MKKIIYYFIIASLVLSLAPTVTFAQESDSSDPSIVACTEEALICSDGSSVGRVLPDCEFAECPGTENGDDDDVQDCATSVVSDCGGDNMLHMVLRVRWGNVMTEEGEEPSTEKTNFDGSISLSSTNEGHVSLIKKLLFDPHNSERDKITSKIDPVSWQSLIYSHWDGVSVLVSGKADDIVMVETTQGSISRTIEQLYEASAPIIEDVGDGREVVVKVLPYKKRSFLLQILWGRGIVGQRVDFTGSAVINSGAEGKRYKTIRFEPGHGDEVTATTKTSIEWNSYIYGGVDGILARIVADKNIDNEDTITVSFTSDVVNYSKSFSLLDLYHNRITKVEVPVGVATCLSTDCPESKPYYLRLAVKRHPNRKVVKAKDSSTVYMLEDDAARPILSSGVFEANGLSWSDIEEIPQYELDSYATGENLNYPDGTLVKGSGSAVYAIADGQKRPIASAAVFLGLGYQWGNIKKIRDPEVTDYDTGATITDTSDYPTGSLVREEGTAGVYLIEGSKKKPIPSTDVFRSNAYNWDNVLVVPKAKRSKITQFDTGKKLGYPDGTLIKGSTPSVYVIDKGEKRPFSSSDDFLSHKYQWTQIKTVSDSDINAYNTGSAIVGRDI